MIFCVSFTVTRLQTVLGIYAKGEGILDSGYQVIITSRYKDAAIQRLIQ